MVTDQRDLDAKAAVSLARSAARIPASRPLLDLFSLMLTSAMDSSSGSIIFCPVGQARSSPSQNQL